MKEKSLAALSNKLEKDSKEKLFEYVSKVMVEFEEEILREREKWSRELEESQRAIQRQQREIKELQVRLEGQEQASGMLRAENKQLEEKLIRLKKEKLQLEENVPLYRELEKHFNEAKDLSVLVNYQNVENKCLKLLEQHRLAMEESYSEFKVHAESRRIAELEEEKKNLEEALNSKEWQLRKLAQKKHELDQIESFEELKELKAFISTRLFDYCRRIQVSEHELKNLRELDILRIIYQRLEDINDKKVESRLQEQNRRIYSNLKEIRKLYAGLLRDRPGDEPRSPSTEDFSKTVLKETALLVKRLRKYEKDDKKRTTFTDSFYYKE